MLNNYNENYDPNLLFKIRATFYWLAGVLITGQIAVDVNLILYFAESGLLIAIVRSLMSLIILLSFTYLCHLFYKLKKDRKLLFVIVLFLVLIPPRLINVFLESLYLFEENKNAVFQKYNLAISIITSVFFVITFIVLYLTVQSVMKSTFNILILGYSIIMAATWVFYHVILYLDFKNNYRLDYELTNSAAVLHFVLPFIMDLLLGMFFIIKASEIKNILNQKTELIAKK